MTSVMTTRPVSGAVLGEETMKTHWGTKFLRIIFMDGIVRATRMDRWGRVF